MLPSVNRKRFFEHYRDAFGRLRADQVAGLEFLLASLEADPFISDLRQASYILATAAWETARTFAPIDERGSDAYFEKRYGPQTRVGKRLGNTSKGDGARYHGRGFVQLTGLDNYRKMGDRLGLPLADDPDMAKLSGVAYQVMSEGMRHGFFTSKKLADYITPTRADYVNARRIINGTDRAHEIAELAEGFEAALRAATDLAAADVTRVNLQEAGGPDAATLSPVAASGISPASVVAENVAALNVVSPPGPAEPVPGGGPGDPTQKVTSGSASWARQIVGWISTLFGAASGYVRDAFGLTPEIQRWLLIAVAVIGVVWLVAKFLAERQVRDLHADVSKVNVK